MATAAAAGGGCHEGLSRPGAGPGVHKGGGRVDGVIGLEIMGWRNGAGLETVIR